MHQVPVGLRPDRRASTLALIALLAAACSTSSPASTATQAAQSSPAPGGTTSSPAATPIPSPAATLTPAPSIGPAMVDFVITGARTATAKGTAGCQRAKSPSGAPIFFWQDGERDYPTLYDGMIVGENIQASGTTIDLKWVVRGSITYTNAAPIPYAGDGHTVSLDDDMTGVEGTVHVKGTITCP